MYKDVWGYFRSLGEPSKISIIFIWLTSVGGCEGIGKRHPGIEKEGGEGSWVFQSASVARKGSCLVSFERGFKGV